MDKPMILDCKHERPSGPHIMTSSCWREATPEELVSALVAGEYCPPERHDWYRPPSAPPDVCLRCRVERDRG